MEVRKITVFDAQTSARDAYDSAAETWGAFKSEVNRDFSSKKVTMQSTKTNLEDDEAILPEGDQILFLFQKESKFGVDDEHFAQKLDEMIARLDTVIEKLSVLEKIDGMINEAEDLDALAKEAREVQERTSG